MSWFNNSFSDLAKDALSKAQASIDAALEIEPEQDPLNKNDSLTVSKASRLSKPKPSVSPSSTKPDDWGSWSSSTMNTLWTSAGSLAAAQTSLQSASSSELIDGRRKKSNTLKLGQKRTTRVSSGSSSPRTLRGAQTTRSSTDLTSTSDSLVTVPTKGEEEVSLLISGASSPSVEQISEEDLPNLETPTESNSIESKLLLLNSEVPPQSSNLSCPADPSEPSSMLSTESSVPSNPLPVDPSILANPLPAEPSDTLSGEPSNTLSKCSSSSALSTQMSTSTTSTLTSSINTVPGDIGPVVEDSSSNDEDSVRYVRTPHRDLATPHKDLATPQKDLTTPNTVTEEKGGWSEEGLKEDETWEERSREVSKESLESESLPGSSSSDVSDRDRCFSIESSGNSSSVQLIQSQSPSETAESEVEVKSDEDTMRTPTNQAPVPSTKIHLVHQTIDEESGKDVTPTVQSIPKKMRVITSPVSSDHSDFVVLNEGSPASTSPREMSELLKVKEVLHAREQRLFTISQENAGLQDELLTERQRSASLEQQLNILSNKHANTVQELQEELDVVEELRNHIEEELSVLKEQGNIEELVEQSQNKDELIAELIQEGEKLSQTSFNSQNNVKKLRAKEKEDEKIIKEQMLKIEGFTAEIEKLKKELKINKDLIKEKDANSTELSSIISTQSEEMSTLKSTLEDLDTEKLSMKSNLESCYKQISELQQINFTTQSKVERESMSANLKAQEETKTAVKCVKEESEQQKKMMYNQIEELQEMVSRLEQQSVWKEQRHRDQMQELHIRIEDAVGRNQDLSSSISTATQPLLRQIQLLQESHSSQHITWEKVEKSLNERLEETRTELLTIEEEKRDMTERIQGLNSKLRALQTQLETTRSSKSQIEVELEVSTSRLDLLEEDIRKEAMKTESTKCQYLQSLTESKNYSEKLKAEIDMLRIHLLDAEKVNEEEVSIASRSSTPPSEMSSQTFILERSLGMYTSSPQSPSPNAHTSYAVEKLTSQLKHSQGEIKSYQEQIRALELSKSSLSAEITLLSGGFSELENNLADYPKVKKANKELQTRYDTLLQMYGEKAEEVHELQLDLSDVKEAYKAQIEQLLSKVIR